MITDISEVKNLILETLQKSDVKKAGLFGSIIKGEITEESDIDILIEFKGKKGLFDLVRLRLKLEEVLGRNVDLLTYNSLHPLLKDRILTEQQVIL